MLDEVLAMSLDNRLNEMERRQKGTSVKGDFDGSVAGSWVKLDSNGAGIVSYNGKEYTTIRLGFTSIPAGTAVELTFGNGYYYSKW